MTESFNEIPKVFACQGESLMGVLHHVSNDQKIGVVIIVGGPQYRVGSHRQFVLLARYLAKQKIPVLRFDYRGMGDSSGTLHDFDSVKDDIRAAIDVLMNAQPSLEKVVLWGLCDAASASLMYAGSDKRVSGLILLNPWVRTEAGEARAYLKHYYIKRFLTKAFWAKVFSGKFNLYASLRSFLSLTKAVRQSSEKLSAANQDDDARPLPERMLSGLKQFAGQSLVILSGQDLTADQFRDLVASSADWRNTLKQKSVELKNVEEANHTFSSENWRGLVEKMSCEWIKGLKR